MSSDPWAARAATVAERVTGAYGHRLAGLPGTWIGRVSLPGTRPRPPRIEWNYWWQAHFVDCLVDAARREWHLASEPPSAPPAWVTLAQRVIRSIRLRNFGRFENLFFDDMAWLALAASRAERLAREIGLAGLPPAGHAAEVLGRRLVSGDTLDLGGGMFWNTKRQYKNTAATGPAALFFARSDAPRDRIRAQALVDWLFENLLDPSSGLLLDGIDLRRNKSGYLTTTVNHDIWTYNQGPALGALLELGAEPASFGSPAGSGFGEGLGGAISGGPTGTTAGKAAGPPGDATGLTSNDAPAGEPALKAQASNLTRAERLIEAIAAGLTTGDGGATGGAQRSDDGGATGGALRSDGDGGDHGLFRGILARYLALAAVSPQLSSPARETAKGLVLATAEQVWAAEARAAEGPAPERSAPESAAQGKVQPYAAAAPGAFQKDASAPPRPPRVASGPATQLSSRLQAWMVLEAAAVVAAAPAIPGPAAPDAT